jgi:patatin-like phospholipase/acyl hydrolase
MASDSPSASQTEDLYLLSLDGGGVRGLSSLFVLKSIMQGINPSNPPKPCEYFNMICGTSTGGLIAIMLGRLQMSVDECIEKYTELSRKVFRTSWYETTVGITGNLNARYDTKALMEEIQKIVEEKTGDVNCLLLDDSDSGCKVFVASTNAGTTAPHLFTSYWTDRWDPTLIAHTKIWEAARATSAASTFFEPIEIGPHRQVFLDGGTGANNPVQLLVNEAKYV